MVKRLPACNQSCCILYFASIGPLLHFVTPRLFLAHLTFMATKMKIFYPTPCPEALGVGTSTYESERDTVQPVTTFTVTCTRSFEPTNPFPRSYFWLSHLNFFASSNEINPHFDRHSPVNRTYLFHAFLNVCFSLRKEFYLRLFLVCPYCSPTPPLSTIFLYNNKMLRVWQSLLTVNLPSIQDKHSWTLVRMVWTDFN